jgi:TolB protein
MKKIQFRLILLPIILFAALVARGQNEPNNIVITSTIRWGLTPPIPVALEGFSGEVADVLRFDLYVQGFSFVTPDAAQYVISGSNDGNVQGRVSALASKIPLLARSYTGASLRSQAHAFANDIVETITHEPGISLTHGSTARIAFKREDPSGEGEIYVADFDGNDPQAVTHDNVIVSHPSWVPGQLALYYNSYKLNNPDVFYHNLATGERHVVAHYSGSNISPAASPDGSKVAMILSKGGSPNVYVCNADGSGLKKLTDTSEDSSPCWSPDGDWICFATKIKARRLLAKVSASGGEVQTIRTIGVSNPTEPSWSPDGKWIAFTSQMGEFDICVAPANGGSATVLVRGEDPSWAPNSRTLIYARRTPSYRYVLSVLDAQTKQFKDESRVSGSNSEPAWAR